MAAIAIGATSSSDLFSISLDAFQWDDLSVCQNGTWTAINQSPNGSFQFNQTKAGPIDFKATAGSGNITIVNPPNLLYITGANNQHTYLTTIIYETNNAQSTVLVGHLATLNTGLSSPVTGQQVFSQQGMTGTFNVTK